MPHSGAEMVRYAVVSIFGTLAFADAIEKVTRRWGGN
jgi:hypothetical protein